ncbi:DUF421 domain-containing protein [Devosia neptuniae]|uniref:DUF421 domain-containing protein n=1 Tax=Devosia neptuniae TaxID=191302 RepID=UPI0022AE9C05|nr:YetF domain-containing protein [Devosia neptuniae]MCZ4345529.1 DUF421 domain-containing protein [Devosia neptuniae]
MEQPAQGIDLIRIFVGDQGAWIYLEILFRTLIVYGYGLLLLRWLGSRTIGQLSTVEFLLVIALGSAVGDPMFQPDVPLLHAMAVITIVVLANRGLDMLIARYKRVERLVDGEPRQIVDQGVLSEVTGDAELGASEIFQKLRQAGVKQLGEVSSAFVEPNGAMSIFRHDGTPPWGLPIVPPWEIVAPQVIAADHLVDHQMHLSCCHCGTTIAVGAGQGPGACRRCGHDRWTPATR